MSKYYALLKYELKNLLRDKMNATMFVYPIFMLVMSVFLFPVLFEGVEGQGLQVTMLILIIALISFGYMIASILLGFSLLDNKDEDTMQTIAVTPIAKKGYVNFKLIYTYVLSVLSTIVILGGTKLFASEAYVLEVGAQTVKLFDNLNYLHVVLFSLSSSLLVPALGLFIVALSKNKVEGFAYMKASGFFIFIPMLVLFPAFQGAKQFLLSVFPNFWGVQGILNLMLPNLFTTDVNLSFYVYMLVGAILCSVYSYFSYKFYMKRAI
jgi:fluoroquinolone transport system permease protein